MGADEYEACVCGSGDEICRKIEMIMSRLDDLTHRVADIEFKIGIFAQSMNQRHMPAIEEIFDKIDEMDRKVVEKKR